MEIARRFALLVTLFAGLSACARGSDATAERFFLDIDRGDFQSATELFSPELHEKFGVEVLAAAVERLSAQMRAHGGVKSVRLRGGVVTFNQLALYDVMLNFGDGTVKSLQTSVVHIDGEWRINTAL
mgnify:FL=1|jgi:hypothetical protein